MANNLFAKLFPRAFSLPKVQAGKDADQWTSSPYIDRNYLSFLQDFTAASNRRSDVYNDVTFLDQDELVARALDIFMEDALQIDKLTSRSIVVKSKYPAIEKEIVKLFTTLGMEERLPLLTRESAKFGDKFAKLRGRDGDGIMFINNQIDPKDIVRLEKDGQISAYCNIAKDVSEKGLANPWDYVHFCHVGNAVILDDLRKEASMFLKDFDETSQYGTSMIFKARKPAKKLNLAMDSLALARMSRGVTTQVHNVEIGNATIPQQIQILADYVSHYKKQDRPDYSSGGSGYKSDFNPLGFGGMVINPVRNGKGAATIQTIGGDVDVSSIVDIDKMESRLFAALGMPPEYLAFQGTGSSINLLQVDLRYSRSIMKLQRTVIIGLMHLAQIHLGYKRVNPDPSMFEIRLVPVSSVNETERVQVMDSLVELSKKIYELLTSDDKLKVNRPALIKYLLTFFLQLPNFDMNKIISTQEGESTGGERSPNEGVSTGSDTEHTSIAAADLELHKPGNTSELPQGVEQNVLNIIAKDPQVQLMLDSIKTRLYGKTDGGESSKSLIDSALTNALVPNRGTLKSAKDFTG